ncbi:energy transducer TonB [Phenylobacterium sp.]|uniref:energy transducer TonB n=1 Tax=Phenylobacterium sp. TaxID=1871053 RepID=UPI0030F48ABC
MVQVVSMTGGPSVYRGGRETAQQRTAAVGVVMALHAGLVGIFVVAQLRPPPPPPERTLSVSFITEAAPSAAPAPSQPPPPPPEAQMMATPRSTLSPMTAPPTERPPERIVPTQAAPPAPAAPAAAPSNAPVATATTPPNFTAAYLKNPGAVYPMGSRRRREQGVVRLRVQVSPEGAPSQVLLDRTSGSVDLDAAAMEVVKKRWKFAPAKQGDRAVSAWVIVPMEFSLDL